MHNCQIATAPEAKNISDCLATVWEGFLPRADADRPGNSLAGYTMLRSGTGSQIHDTGLAGAKEKLGGLL